MDVTDLEAYLKAAEARLQSQRSEESIDAEAAALDLDVAYEELHAAVEELCEQNDTLSETREQVEAERRRYLELFDFAPDGYLLTRPDGIITEANHAAAALLLAPQSALVGKPFPVFVSPSARRDFRIRLVGLQPGRVEQWQFPLQPRRGPEFQAAISVAFLSEKEGRAAGVRWLFRDASAQKRAMEAELRSDFLARLLASLGDYPRLLEQITALAIPTFAEVCMIHIRSEDGKVDRAHVASAEPITDKLLNAIERRWPLDIEANHPAGFVLRTGKRRFVPQVNDQILLSLSRGPRHLDDLRALDLKSLISIPLRARGRLLGAITFGVSSRTYGPGDIVMAESLARHIALALDHARICTEMAAALNAQTSAWSEGRERFAHMVREIGELARQAREQVDQGGIANQDRIREIEERASKALELLEDFAGAR